MEHVITIEAEPDVEAIVHDNARLFHALAKTLLDLQAERDAGRVARRLWLAVGLAAGFTLGASVAAALVLTWIA